MTIEFRTAERRKSRLRVGMSGPSGSGKTYSALLIARGLTDSWEKVFLIDTENGSAELYSDLGPFRVFNLQAPFAPERYIEALKAAEDNGAECIVIDSTSHEWDGKGGCLEINELVAKTKFRGNTWSAWSETTPRHQKFIEAIVTSSCHVITTARSKTDTIQTEDKKIKKVGLKEIQRDGFEYELTVNFNIDRDGHYALASKDRTGLFINRDPFVILQKTGEELLAWTESGATVTVSQEEINRTKAKILHCLSLLGADVSTPGATLDSITALTQLDPTNPDNAPAILAKLETLVKAQPKNKPAEPKAPDPSTGELSPEEEAAALASIDAATPADQPNEHAHA